jgi:hypothetical protein
LGGKIPRLNRLLVQGFGRNRSFRQTWFAHQKYPRFFKRLLMAASETLNARASSRKFREVAST